MRDSELINLDEAGQEFVRVWGDGYLAGDIAPSLTCTEVTVIHDLLVTLGAECEAGTWLAHHTRGDDGGDLHHTDSDPEQGVR